MHYTGTIWRPPYEAGSLIIEATAGCTHHRCKFCTLYEDLPFKFRPSPLEDIEADLLEAQTWYHDPLRKAEERLFETDAASCRRVFLAGANPFGLKTAHLLKIAALVRTYFPQCESVGCFSRVTDVARKTDAELCELTEAGFDGLTIGIETGDDEALAFMDKAARRRRHQLRVLLPGGHLRERTRHRGRTGDSAGVQPDESLAYRREHAHRLRELSAASGDRDRKVG